MDDVSREMPQYQSHKKVWALEIDRVEKLDYRSTKAWRIIFKEQGYAPADVDDKMFARYKPVSGDYYVVYPGGDGYASISPRKAFSDGYTRI